MDTHGGRARAIESGDLKSMLQSFRAGRRPMGNGNGIEGPSACGSWVMPSAI